MKTINGVKVIWDCKVKELREQAGLTLRELAAAVGMKNPTISFIERGTNPGLDNAFKLAAYFGFPIEKIWRKL